MRVGKEIRKSSRTENGKSKIEKRKMGNQNFKISDLNIFLRFFVLEISKIKNEFSKREISKQENLKSCFEKSFLLFLKIRLGSFNLPEMILRIRPILPALLERGYGDMDRCDA